MKSAGKARNNGLYRHIRTSKEIIRNLLNDSYNTFEKACIVHFVARLLFLFNQNVVLNKLSLVLFIAVFVVAVVIMVVKWWKWRTK